MVRGLAVIRGVPLPVVALAALFHADPGACGCFVVVRTGERRVALAVDAVRSGRSSRAPNELSTELREEGYDVVQACSGKGALELLHPQPQK
jgi:hypothetical protein